MEFLSTPSARRATLGALRVVEHNGISIHALREEGDSKLSMPLSCSSIFLSTPSARRATRTLSGICFPTQHFYPRPPRGGRLLSNQGGFLIHQFLSTPSARRATPPGRRDTAGRWNFYPRPPRGGRLGCRWALSRASRFLSTPSARRATLHSALLQTLQCNFYPRPPRGGRHVAVHRGNAVGVISIHALREEGDRYSLPAQVDRSISIHALREEGDGRLLWR